MATLTSTRKAPILDQDGNQLSTMTCNVASSNGSVVGIEWGTGLVFAVGNAAGDATLTATRLADQSVAILEVTVVAAPFAISLGAEVPA
jgi:hypothetical protein